MRQIFALAILVVLYGTATGAELPRVRPESAGMSAAGLAGADRVVAGLIRGKKLAGASVAVTRNGKVVYFKSQGRADIAADKAWENDTILRIYSMTKAVTTAAAMMLHEKGRFRLDDPVSKYLPQFVDVEVWNEGRPAPITGCRRRTICWWSRWSRRCPTRSCLNPVSRG